jgi:M6 family metalloprotease-like protein
VIYARWDDVDYPSGFDAAAVARRFFGTGFPSTEFPSVGDYFRRLSFNDVFLFPILETQGAHDGVVQVQVPGTKAQFFAQSEAVRNRILVELADPFVDYSYYDTDGNGALSNLELVVNAYEAAPETPMWLGGGIARPIAATTRDGITLGGLSAAMTNTSTNLVTIVHENAHVLFDMPDLYGFGVGRLDLAGPTGGADQTIFAPSAWQKLHLGWIQPTVVTRDGFYEIRRADTTGDSFILYDPDRGTDDYFIVENRVRSFGTYEWGISDEGLAIWRISDSSLGVAGAPWPIELMAPDGVRRPPDYVGAPWDAWDPSDPRTPQRTMSQPWADGTPSGLAVRAIDPAGEVVRAYFDVRGPGVLVDTYPLDGGAPVRAVAGSAREIDVPIMNTAESSCDTFDVDPVSLPAGWTMTRGARILCAGESTVARVTVTPNADAAVAVYPIGIQATGRTSGVSTTAQLDVEVVLRATKFDLAGLVGVAPTSVSPTLEIDVGADDGEPVADLAGVQVRFTLAGPGDTLVLETVTGANGVAAVTAPDTLAPGTWTLTIETERRGELAPTTTTTVFEVLTIERTIDAIAAEIDKLISTATDSRIRSALAAARVELGNSDGPPTNGALDKLADDDPGAAVTKLKAAIGHLLTAERRGAGSLERLEDALGFTAEAIARDELAKALDAVGTPSQGEAASLARIEANIEAGRDQLDADRYAEACDEFRQAVSRARDLSR